MNQILSHIAIVYFTLEHTEPHLVQSRSANIWKNQVKNLKATIAVLWKPAKTLVHTVYEYLLLLVEGNMHMNCPVTGCKESLGLNTGPFIFNFWTTALLPPTCCLLKPISNCGRSRQAISENVILLEHFLWNLSISKH